MRSIGSALILLGVLAIGLDFINMVPKVLRWIYAWGNEVAWMIKGGIVVVGIILYIIGKPSEESDE